MHKKNRQLYQVRIAKLLFKEDSSKISNKKGYIPHHDVNFNNSKTVPGVFDASAKCDNISLGRNCYQELIT